MTRNFWRRTTLAAAAAASLSLAAPAARAVEYANIDVANGAPEQSGAPTVTRD